MSVSVQWLVDQPQLGLAALAGTTGLQRSISWAHSIELADPVPWLRGGELLLTTGLRLPRSAAARRSYVRQVAEAGVAALGFGTGLSFQDVPAEILACADEIGLPVLQVPLATPFIAVTKAVMERLAEQEYEGVVRASRIQPRMTRAALHGGRQAVVRELSQASEAQVILTGADGAVVTAYPDSAVEAAPDVLDQLRAAAEAEEPDSMTTTGPHGVIAAQVVRVGARLHGRLVVVARRTLTTIDHLMIGHAVSLIAIEHEMPLRLRDTQNRVNALLAGLLVGSDPSSGALRQHLTASGFSTEGGVVVIVFQGASPDFMLSSIDRVLSERDLPCFAVRHEGTAVALLPAASSKEAHALTLDVSAQLHPSPSAGVACADDLSSVRKALRQATIASAVARTRRTRIVHFDSLAGHVLQASPESRAVLTLLAETRIRPLVESDQCHGHDLVATLRAFLEHNGRGEAASAALGVHRHTLRNRTERIERLLGVDLDSAHVRAELLLALDAVPDHE